MILTALSGWSAYYRTDSLTGSLCTVPHSVFGDEMERWTLMGVDINVRVWGEGERLTLLVGKVRREGTVKYGD